MNLNLNLTLGNGYRSQTQKARVISEAWTEENAFCCACGGSLSRSRNNSRVLDFKCTNCQGEFELKSTRGNFSSKAPDGAYKAMMARLKDVSSPDFFFLTYDSGLLRVTNFFAVPTSFLDTSVIERRKPLRSTARRSGWVGCNIAMTRIPEVGKVFYVKNSEVRDRSEVITTWERTAFLRQEADIEARGWSLEILRIIQSLNSREFTLQKMYEFEPQLKKRFPLNNFIRPKIRQQLQVLRDAGFLTFEGRGHYSITSHPSTKAT